MKSSDVFKLFAILVCILFFSGILVVSIVSTILGFLEEQGINTTTEVKAATTLAIILLLAAATYLLVKK